LGELGYCFALDIDGYSGEAVQAGHWYHYNPEHGLTARGAVAEPARPAFSGADLLAIAADDLSGTARVTAKRLLRLALGVHLGEAPLRSRELFRAHAGAAHAPDAAVQGQQR
jgi:DNA repair protein RecO (recombination protein O)